MSAAPLEARRATPRTEDLHGQYRAAVLAYCSRRLRSREEAEDATQIVFLNAYRRLAEGVVPQSDPAWLFTIAHNVVLQRSRMLARRARVEFPADLTGVEHAPAPEAAPELSGLAEALARLTEPQRRAIVLREWAGLSYREIAAELDLSISAVETLIFRARRNLARRVEPGDRKRKRALGIWLPGGVKSLVGGAAVKVATGAASVAVIVAAGSPLVSHSGPAAATVPAVHHGAAAAVSSLRESFRPFAAVAFRSATGRASVPRRPAPATTGSGRVSVDPTAPTSEADPPAVLPEPSDSGTPPEPVTPDTDPAPAPIADVPTAATEVAPSPPGPPPVAPAPESAGPPAALPPTAAGQADDAVAARTLPDAAVNGPTLPDQAQGHGPLPATPAP